MGTVDYRGPLRPVGRRLQGPGRGEVARTTWGLGGVLSWGQRRKATLRASRWHKDQGWAQARLELEWWLSRAENQPGRLCRWGRGSGVTRRWESELEPDPEPLSPSASRESSSLASEAAAAEGVRRPPTAVPGQRCPHVSPAVQQQETR